jgi:hypothetical protein
LPQLVRRFIFTFSGYSQTELFVFLRVSQVWSFYNWVRDTEPMPKVASLVIQLTRRGSG